MNLMRRRALKLGTLLGAPRCSGRASRPSSRCRRPGRWRSTTTVLTDADGHAADVWIASGGALEQAANASYFVFNRTLGGGVIATARNDGSFTAPPMPGNQNDQVLVYYKTPYGDYSDSLCVLLQPGTAGSSLTACP